MSWEKLKLEEIGLITSGGTPSTGNPAYWNGEIPWITPKDLSNFENRYIENGERNISDEGLKNSSAKLVKEKSVLLSSRAPIGYLAIAQNDLTTNQGFKNITPNEKCDYLYLFYCLKNNVEYLKSLGIGATYPELSSSRLKEIQIPVPSLPTQRKIATILSAYDDLIENNLKRIKLLEEKAFLRYKEIVKNEKLEKIQLKDVAVVNQSTLKSNTNIDKILYVDISSVSTGSIDSKTEYDLKDAPGRAKRIVKHEDIIWSCVRPNRKSFSIVWRPEENLIASTGFAVITAQKIPSTFLYQLITENEFVGYLENNAKGAAYPAVTAKDFEDGFIKMPSNTILEDYHSEISSCFELKYILQNQNAKLREARDILLPKLMNGQIEV